MGTNFCHSNPLVGLVGTTRLITVTTAAAQVLALLTSGAILVNFQNNGPANCALGDSAMLMGSGDVVFPYANREFYPVSDNFSTYARADSVATVLAVTEYYSA